MKTGKELLQFAKGENKRQGANGIYLLTIENGKVKTEHTPADYEICVFITCAGDDTPAQEREAPYKAEMERLCKGGSIFLAIKVCFITLPKLCLPYMKAQP